MTVAAALRMAGGAALAVAALTGRAASQPPRPQSSPPVLAAPIDPAKGVNFRAAVDRARVYVGEQITYQVGVFLDDETRRRLRRNPEFTPPEPRAMLAYDLPSPTGPSGVRVERGRRFEVHVFQRALFPIAAGIAAIPPARLSYAIPLSNSFFAREERRTARADSLTVEVVPLPPAGRPPDFAGAVGLYEIAVHVDTAPGRVGDPLLLTARVRGTGNIKLLPRPSLALSWAHAVPSGERVTLDSNRTTVSGHKEFTWLVTPRRSGEREVPALRYPFFDPAHARYGVATSEPRAVRVRAGSLAAADPAVSATSGPPPLVVRSHFRGELPAPLPQRPWFWAAAFLAPVPAIVVAARRRERRARRRSAAAELFALTRDVSPAPAVVRRRFAESLAERVAIGPATLVSERAMARALRRAGVTRATAADAAQLFGELDAAAFGGGTDAPHAPAERAAALYRRVDAEARHRLAPPLWSAIALAASLAATAAAVVHAASVGHANAERAFALGLREYGARRFAAATGAFGEAARHAPRASDAWANFGTAAWEANDTARAAAGWQRAVRLEPTARDVRERLELLPGEQTRGAAWVPPVPVTVAAAVALALWGGACVLALRRAVRHQPAAARSTAAIAGAAAAWAAVAWVADDARAARRLDVVTSPGESRRSPALGAEAGPALRAGEVVRVVARRGAWTLLALDGGREAWFEASRLTPLAAQ